MLYTKCYYDTTTKKQDIEIQNMLIYKGPQPAPSTCETYNITTGAAAFLELLSLFRLALIVTIYADKTL